METRAVSPKDRSLQLPKQKSHKLGAVSTCVHLIASKLCFNATKHNTEL